MDPQRMLHYLPGLYRDVPGQDGVLDMLLAAADRLQSPVEHLLDTLDEHVDPRRAPERFVPYLASWLGLDRYFDWPGGRHRHGTPRYAAGMPALRELVARSSSLARWRGTRGALEGFLEAATGLPGFGVAEAPDRDFHLVVTAPAAAAAFADLVARVVEEERPAYATFEIHYPPTPAPAPISDPPQET